MLETATVDPREKAAEVDKIVSVKRLSKYMVVCVGLEGGDYKTLTSL